MLVTRCLGGHWTLVQRRARANCRYRQAMRILCALLAALAGCASLPETVAREPSRALLGADTQLGRALAQASAAKTGKSGIYALGDGRNAFAARVLLARAAERSLDV